MPPSATLGSIASQRQLSIPWVAEAEPLVRTKGLEDLKVVCTRVGVSRDGNKNSLARRILALIERYHAHQDEAGFTRIKTMLNSGALQPPPRRRIRATRQDNPSQQLQRSIPGNYVDAGTQTEDLPANEKWWIRERKEPQKRILSLAKFLLKRTNAAREERQARITADAVAEEVLREILGQVMEED